jgi:hypothetical protein
MTSNLCTSSCSEVELNFFFQGHCTGCPVTYWEPLLPNICQMSTRLRQRIRFYLLKGSDDGVLQHHWVSRLYPSSNARARILEIESNSRYRKYNESVHMICLTSPFSQPSLDISPAWIPFISREVTNSRYQYDVSDSSKLFICLSLEFSVFTPQLELAVGPLLVSLIFHSLSYTDVMELGCWIDLWDKFSLPSVS